MCGLEAEGHAEVDGTPYCHGERKVTCYEVSHYTIPVDLSQYPEEMRQTIQEVEANKKLVYNRAIELRKS